MFQAEALAISQACDLYEAQLEQGNTLPAAITIYSDSQSVLKALASRWIRSRTILSCIEKLNSVGRWASVQLCWVKGHSGVPGNERADRLAKASLSGGRRYERVIPRSAAYYRMAFKDFLYESWTRQWSSDQAFARQTRLWFPEPSFRKSRAIISLDREAFSRLIRWLSGFAFLRGLGAKINGEDGDDDSCRLCEEAVEKADHILRECPALNQHRWDCFGTYQLSSGMGWEVMAVHKFLSDQRVRSLEDSDPDDTGQDAYESSDAELR